MVIHSLDPDKNLNQRALKSGLRTNALIPGKNIWILNHKNPASISGFLGFNIRTLDIRILDVKILISGLRKPGYHCIYKSHYRSSKSRAVCVSQKLLTLKYDIQLYPDIRPSKNRISRRAGCQIQHSRSISGLNHGRISNYIIECFDIRLSVIGVLLYCF